MTVMKHFTLHAATVATFGASILSLSGCGGGAYDEKMQQRIAELRSGTGSVAGAGAGTTAATNIDPRLFPSPIDVADKNGQPTGIRLHLPKEFFNASNQPAFQALGPNNADAASIFRTRGAKFISPDETILVNYELAWTNPANNKTMPLTICFKQFASGGAPSLDSFFNNTPKTEFMTAQGVAWNRVSHDGLMAAGAPQADRDAVIFVAFARQFQTRDLYVSFLAPKEAADALQWESLVDACMKTISAGQ